jgi:hypothetical protein
VKNNTAVYIYDIYKVMRKFILYLSIGKCEKKKCRVIGDVLPLFHGIPGKIQAFLPGLHKLQYATALEVHFSILQPYTHNLTDCIIIFVVLAPHAIF